VTSHVDPALLEMFAAEVETHMAALNDGVLALEQNPDQSQRFEALMRAAHSIKGAAKLVGLQAAVEVAHVIEDCFVAAREGRLAMTSNLVDVLLEGVDLLGRAAQFDAPPEDRVTQDMVAATVQNIVRASTKAPSVVVTAAFTGKAPENADPTATQNQDTAIRLHGALDAGWISSIHREFDRLLKGGHAIMLDLGNITEIDPLALALLAQVARLSSETPHSLILKNVPARFDALLRAIGLAPNLATVAGEI